MEQMSVNGEILLIGKAADVFAELERIAAFSRYGIGWCHPLSPGEISGN
jgi:hypothetical protein